MEGIGFKTFETLKQKDIRELRLYSRKRGIMKALLHKKEEGNLKDQDLIKLFYVQRLGRIVSWVVIDESGTIYNLIKSKTVNDIAFCMFYTSYAYRNRGLNKQIFQMASPSLKTKKLYCAIERNDPEEFYFQKLERDFGVTFNRLYL